jgi:hypothetical protein
LVFVHHLRSDAAGVSVSDGTDGFAILSGDALVQPLRFVLGKAVRRVVGSREFGCIAGELEVG